MTSRRIGRAVLPACVLAVLLHLPARADGSPNVHFVDVQAGPVRGGPANAGVPITIYGTGFGSRRGASTVTIGGRPVARYRVWGRTSPGGRLQTIVVQPGSAVRGGRIVVRVGARRSRQDVTFVARPGRVFVVAVTGSDRAVCTVTAPCATVGHVIANRTRPGDTVLMRGGRYSEAELWIRGDHGQSGAPGRHIVIAPWPGERVELVDASRPWIVDADYVTVAGLWFLNGKSTGVPDVGLPGHRGNRFIGNAFRGTIGFGALDLHGDRHLVAGNDCEVDGSSVGTQGHCYYVSYGTGVRVRDNVAAGATGYGIHVFDQQRRSNDFRRTIRDLTIDGNLLRSSRERSGLIIAMGDEGGLGNAIRGVTIRGNVLTQNNHAGITLGSNVSVVRIAGNRFVQNGRVGLVIAGDPSTRDVTVTANAFVQSANGFCTSNCGWFSPAHIEVGAGAAGVAIRGNDYAPGRPTIVGGRDVAPR